MRVGQKPLDKHFKYMRPFFFLFTIVVTLVTPSTNRQGRRQRDRVRTGREGDVYVYAQLLQQDRQRGFQLGRGRAISGRVGRPLWGRGGLITCTWGWAAAALCSLRG